MSNEYLLQKARDIISTRRQKAFEIAQFNMNKLQNELPKAQQLKHESAKLCSQAAVLAASGGDEKEVENLLSLAKKTEQEREKVLKNAGFNSENLKPKFECALCEDTGFLNGKYCNCVQELTKSLRRNELNESSPFSLCKFEDFSINKYPEFLIEQHGITAREHMQSIYSYCKAYADNFELTNASLYMCGYAGLGKTHLALSIANVVLEKGYDVVYTSSQEAFENIEKERFGTKEGDTLQTMLNAQLLIVDDLGTEFITNYISACLYNLVNARKNPTIYTSNIVDDSVLRRRYTEKIVSRLLGNCEVLTFCGEDIRLLNKGY